MPRYPHTTKPDLDNLVKGLKDAMTGIAWHDDTQVYLYADVRKWVASGGEKPHVVVSVREVTSDELEGGPGR
jgi:Holliday junction resolvase RusA-like endonuclease